MLLKEQVSELTFGRIRSINSRIRGGEHSIRVLYLFQKFEATVKCCTQNGVRGGSDKHTHTQYLAQRDRRHHSLKK